MIQTHVNGKVYDDFSFVEELTEAQAQRLTRNLYDVIMVLADGRGDPLEEIPSDSAGWAAGGGLFQSDGDPQGGA